MVGISQIRLLAASIRPAAGTAWRGLVCVLAGADRSSPRRWRSPGQRRAALIVIGATTLLLCVASVASLSLLFPGHALFLAGRTHSVRVSGPVHWLSGQFWQFGLRDAVLGPGGQVLVAAGLVAPLLLVFRYPLLSWRIGWLGLLLVPLFGINWWGGLPWGLVQLLVMVVVLCAVGVRYERAVLCWMWALTLVPWWLWADKNGPGLLTAAVGTVAFLALAVAVDSTGSRRRAQLTLADQAEHIEQERGRRAVLEERARIARELHDVVAHHMSLIAVRAETAPYRLSGLPAPVCDEFGSLSGAAREALADMRRLLGVLRSDEPAAHAPQPVLADLPALIGEARQAGMTVELTAPTGTDQVPPAAGLCAYRIIQEALSNAGRHAAGAPVAVSLRHDQRAMVLQVASGPGVATAQTVNGHRPGQGLTGMQERVELLGGSLSAGPAPDGSFVVHAVLPLSEPAAQP